jgi:hypothetical protein
VFGGGSESFGKQLVPGDIVGVFLDLVDHTISKDFSLTIFHTSLTITSAWKLQINSIKRSTHNSH